MDITAELSQYEETFAVKFKTENDTAISLTFNYIQAKVLADGLLAMVHKARAKEALQTRSNYLLGDIKVNFSVPQDNTINKNEGVEEKCQPNILPAQMAEISLSEIA